MVDIKRALLLSGAVIGASAFAHAALAATAATTATDTSQSVTTVTDLVVTAERRSENLQETPVAVSALTPNDLKAQRIDTGADLASVAPNLSFQPGLFG